VCGCMQCFTRYNYDKVPEPEKTEPEKTAQEKKVTEPDTKAVDSDDEDV
jgi:hypothetical protein